MNSDSLADQLAAEIRGFLKDYEGMTGRTIGSAEFDNECLEELMASCHARLVTVAQEVALESED